MSRTRKIASAGAVGLFAITTIGAPTLASSHREAPMIATDPCADNTDLYAFVSPDKPDTVTIVADYTGFQEPAGGPNFYPFCPGVQYWVKVDNTGDGVADVTYTFEFTTDIANDNSFLYSGYGSIPGTAPNVTQTLSVTRNGESIGSGLVVPPPNIGPRTTPKYGTIAANAVNALTDASGNQVGTVFAGQRDDPFFADIGAIFDLGGLRPFNKVQAIPLKTAPGQDDLSGYNVNSIAIQVPKSQLSNDGADVTAADAPNALVGIWAGASRQAPAVSGGTSGPWVQVSRLGNPLINEVIIPVGQKDAWNAGNPADDGQYQALYEAPELATIINALYSKALKPVATTGRTDLSLILGQGVPTLNQTNTTGLYDMLRLNMGVPPTKKPNRLGALAGDLAGFPNGRRLGDDVIDIELRAVAQGYGPILAKGFGLPNLSPNNAIGDGCDANDAKFLPAFPYVAQPWPGYSGGQYRNVPCKP